jgi:uncharacterized protein (DUF1697 family)
MALVVFLRGVNVGGHRTFRPTMLAQQLKHFDVVNIGAAGTFVVRAPTSQTRLRAELSRRLPFETSIIICKGQDLLDVAKCKPFGDAPAASGVVRFVSVMAKRPSLVPSIPMSFPRQGKWLMRILTTEKRFVFGQYRRHMKTIGFLGRIDGIFGVPVTTRNWNTIMATVEVLKNPSSFARRTMGGGGQASPLSPN